MFRVPVLAVSLGVALLSGCASESNEDADEASGAMEAAPEKPALVPSAKASAIARSLVGKWSGTASLRSSMDVESFPGTVLVASTGATFKVTVDAGGEHSEFAGVKLAEMADRGGYYSVALDPKQDARADTAELSDHCALFIHPNSRGKELAVFCNFASHKLLNFIDVSVPTLAR